MASGTSTQLTRQIGEALAVAQLGKRGLFATAFAGNVPGFDVLAVGKGQQPLMVEVKAIRGPSWQFDVRKFLNVELRGQRQVVKGRASFPPRQMLCLFIKLAEPPAEDEYYLFRWRVLQDYFARVYVSGRRPRSPGSFHCAVWPKLLARYRDNWRLVTEARANRSDA